MKNQFKKYLSVLMIMILILTAFSACGKEEIAPATESVPTQIQETADPQVSAEPVVSEGYYQIGDKIEDFTITTYDGREISLYKLLDEKDMVLLNLWATWCGPCGYEFPAMQEAYEQYQDKVEIIALSIEATDSDEVLADYVQEKGMSFCVARDTIGLGSRIYSEGIPTSVVVDRFGTICLIEVGAMPDPGIFTNLFDVYTADDYTQSVFMPSMLSQIPTVQPADPTQLQDALNGEGGTLVFANSSNPYHWPMTVEQKDGRTVVAASNVTSAHSVSVLESQVEANAGDALVLEYKLESADCGDFISVEVDGKRVKKCLISRDWGTYAYQFEESGSHDIRICFETGLQDTADGDGLWIDSICVVSGDEAAKALKSNTKYPVGDKTQIQLLNENARKAYVYAETDPSVKELSYFCSDPTLRVWLTLDESIDPENAYLGVGLNSKIVPLAPFAEEDGYLVEIDNANPEEILTGALLYCDGTYVDAISVYLSEELAQQYFDMFRETYGQSLKWEYRDDSVNAAEASGDATYTITYVDQNGDPVPGVMCQVCDETMCQVFTSDTNGVCRFTLPAKAYELHTLMVPTGYEGDTTTITKAPERGGELTFALTKQ